MLQVSQDAEGDIIIRKDGNAWVIKPHHRHGIDIHVMGSSLIPRCKDLIDNPGLCERMRKAAEDGS